VAVSARDGIALSSPDGTRLAEHQLSSGEYHLLFLMVAALATRSRGSVVAIDEPEMSMHLKWQRRLVPALLECAEGGEPLILLATHSPEVCRSCPESLVSLSFRK